MSHGSFYRSQQGRGYIADLTVETPDFGEGDNNTDQMSLSSDQYNHENWWAPDYDPLARNMREQLSYQQQPHRLSNNHETRQDRRIWAEVCALMTDDSYLDASDITVEIEDGEITLTGEVENRAAKRLAESIAESVAGVADIHNRLRVRKSGYDSAVNGRH